MLCYVMLIYMLYIMLYGIWHIQMIHGIGVYNIWSMLDGMVYGIWDMGYGIWSDGIMIFMVCIVMWLCIGKLVRIGDKIGEMN